MPFLASNLAKRCVHLLAAGCALCLLAEPAAAISRDPNGVNVNAQGATTVFITFGGLDNQVPIEATWCGALIPAEPDIGFKCDPSTLFGRLPLRVDQSRLGAGGSVFTDIMSIPPSVARRAWQAAERGENSAFFYVRRFVSSTGGPDEYVFVTCRMAGGGARVPLALLNVQLSFTVDRTALAIERGAAAPPVHAVIHYNGTGRLKGRWEVVLPGEDLPSSRDLLTEATLPPEERASQRRFQPIERFNVFLPPTGKIVLPGPDPRRIPTQLDGLYHLLLRIEASNDKEGDSNLALADAGTGVVHSGAVAGFPIPPLRYYVGSAAGVTADWSDGLRLVAPARNALWPANVPLALSWSLSPEALLYHVQIADESSTVLHAAFVQQGIGSYHAPDWLVDRAPSARLRWRVQAIGLEGREIAATQWRELSINGVRTPEPSAEHGLMKSGGPTKSGSSAPR